jgi:hypothetical protein
MRVSLLVAVASVGVLALTGTASAGGAKSGVGAQSKTRAGALTSVGVSRTEALTVLSPHKIEVQPTGSKPITLVMRNETRHQATPKFATVLDDGTVNASPRRGTPIGRFQIGTVKISFSSPDHALSADGELIVRGGPGAPAAVPLSIKPTNSHGFTTLCLIFGPLVAALFVVWRSWQKHFAWKELKRSIGRPNWDFSKNFAANLTLVGALLATILAAGVLPDDTSYLPKATYGVLSVLFGIVVLVAPLAFLAFQKPTGTVDKDGEMYQGVAGAFLLAALLTVWGVGGELATAGALVGEIGQSTSVPYSVVLAVWGLLLVASVLTALYSTKRIRDMARLQVPPKPPKPPKQGLLSIFRLQRRQPAQVAPMTGRAFEPSQDWTWSF